MPDDMTAVAAVADESAPAQIEEPIADPVAEGAEPAEPQRQDDAEAAPETPAEAAVEPDGRMLSPDVRQHLAELKTTNPTLAGKIRDAFGEAAAIRKEFPGGLAEARSIKELATEIGGKEGVEKIQSALAEIEELDRLWETKDPRAVDNMAEEYPEQFAALMPHALDAWHQRDPEGFNRNACGVVAATLQTPNENGQSAINLLWMAEQSLAIGNADQAKEILAHLQEWAKGFGRIAASVPERKPETPNAEKTRVAELEQQLAGQQQAAFDASVGAAVEAFAESRMDAAIAPYVKGKTLTEGQKETLRSRVVANLTKRLEGDRQFIEARDRYTAARDKAGLIQMSKAKIEALLPGAVKDAHRWLFGGAPPPKVAAPTAAAPGTPAAGAPSVQKPWIKIPKMPPLGEVDGDRTPFEMRMKSSAVLKDGRRVYWGQQPYQGR